MRVPKDMLARWKKCIVTLLLLVYTSQSIAALLMPCQMETSSREAGAATSAAMSMDHESHGMDHAAHGAMHEHAGMSHSMGDAGMATHDAANTPHSLHGKGKFDCCDAMGHCLMGGCTIHGPGNDFAQTLDSAGSKLLHAYRLQRPFNLSSIHFRPPIFG